jgi:hypothetical protein
VRSGDETADLTVLQYRLLLVGDKRLGRLLSDLRWWHTIALGLVHGRVLRSRNAAGCFAVMQYERVRGLWLQHCHQFHSRRAHVRTF